MIGYHLEREREREKKRERGEGARLKLDVQGQSSGRILDVDGQVGWGVLKIGQFSYVICASSLEEG